MNVYATERDMQRLKELRRVLAEELQTENFTCFKFADEPSNNLTYCRRCAHAEGRQRTPQVRPCTTGLV